jgi:hypothetical protein
MTLSPALRKLALTVHLTASVGWIGAVFVYLALGAAAVMSSDDQTIRAAWAAMDLTGWWVIAPLAIAAVVTGLVMSLGTRWGLFRYYWTLISFVLTVLCTGVLLLHMPTVSAMARLAQVLDGGDLRALGGDLFHPGTGLLLLLAITVLNVYKPAGVTPYGWRKQRDEARAARARSAQASSSVAAVYASSGYTQLRSALRVLAAQSGAFTFHLAEMVFAMLIGMAVFMVFRVVLMALDFTALLDPTSIEFATGMVGFMVVPMLIPMRFRGCSWRECSEMGAAMMVGLVAAFGSRALALESASVWFASNQHALMLAGMLAVMLYRRDRYIRGYSPPGWRSRLHGGRSARAGSPIS